MSDIFCKTKFKPILNPRPVMSSDTSRNGRSLKRSFDSSNSGDNDEEVPRVMKFANSNWVAVPPKINRRSLDGVVDDSTVVVPKANASFVIRRAKRQAQSPPELTTVLDGLPPGAVVKKIDPNTTELLLRLLRNTSASAELERKKVTKIYYVYFSGNNNKKQQKPETSQPVAQSLPPRRQFIPEVTPIAAPAPTSRPRPRPRPPQEPAQRQPTQRRPRPPLVEAPPTPAPTTTTTTTPPPPPPPAPEQPTRGLVLTERDYEFGELLCEGRFSGGVPDPRHDCRLYFECNSETIDTFACPEGHRFDAHLQQCAPAETTVCRRPF